MMIIIQTATDVHDIFVYSIVSLISLAFELISTRDLLFCHEMEKKTLIHIVVVVFSSLSLCNNLGKNNRLDDDGSELTGEYNQ